MKRYNDLNSHFKSNFGHRIHKITIDAGLTCPNRNPITNGGGCVYCNQYGSGNKLFTKKLSIKEQIKLSLNKIKTKFKAKKFIAYFQSFSNTYAPIEKLKKMWDEALTTKDIIGIAIATRPDCIDEKILDLLESYTKKYLVWVEYGLQSSHNKTLKLINRGHNNQAFLKAVRLTKKRNIKVCAHIIFGLPNENKQLMLKTADFLSKSMIDAVKFHLLYIIKNTEMEHIYKKGKYKCMQQSEYVSIVCQFIERLYPNIIIQRLCSDPNPNELIAPQWSFKKKTTISMINKLLKAKNTWQGKKNKFLNNK